MPIHEFIEAADRVGSLGVEINGVACEIKSANDRLSKMKGALAAIVDVAVVSGRDLEGVLGSVKFVLLLRRLLLSA